MRKSLLSAPRSLALVAAVLALSLTACGPAASPAAPTVDVTAIYTQAFQTITAQQATQLALAKPTATSSLTPAPLIPNTGATSAIPGTGGGTAAASGTQACDDAIYVSDVTVPDGTTMAPGQTFVKTWSVLNTGSCSWTTSYKLVFLNGDPMGGNQAPLTATVSSGETVNLSVNLTAPTLAGNYKGTWRLQNAAGTYFGDILTVVITVSGTAATATP